MKRKALLMSLPLSFRRLRIELDYTCTLSTWYISRIRNDSGIYLNIVPINFFFFLPHMVQKREEGWWLVIGDPKSNR